MNDEMQRAFATAAEARRTAEQVVDRLASGRADLAQVFAEGERDPLVGRIYAVKVFEAVPGVGKVAARRAMRAAGVPEETRLDDVAEPSRQRIVTALAEASG